MRNNEQGRSMIEMLGVLAIVGVLSVGGIAGYSKAMNKFKTNKLIDQVNMITTNVRTLYSSQRTYNGLNNKLATQVGLIPAEMFEGTSNSEVTHVFGGTLTLDTANSDSWYYIEVEDVPSSACLSIVTTDWGGDSGSGLVGMYVGDTAGSIASASAPSSFDEDGTGGLYAPSALPMSIADSNTSCGTNGMRVIGWMFM